MDISLIEYYRKINNTNGLSKNDVIINTAKKNVLSGFNSCGKYFKCKVNGFDKELLIYGSSNSTISNEKMNFITKPNEYLIVGDLIEWDSLNWLVTELDAEDSVYCQGKIQQCNNTLKFYNKKSILCEVPCIAEQATGLSLDENKSFSLLDGNLKVKIQSNENTKEIYEGQRFIVNNYAYRVIGIDDVTGFDVNKNGYYILKLEKVADNPKDDFINGIAYNENVIPNNFQIKILNGSSITINKNQGVSLDTQVLNNSEIVSPSPELIYTSSDLSICSIDTTGKINGLDNGECVITVSLKSEPSIVATINIKVQEVIADKYSIQFVNHVTQIKLGKSESISCKSLNNGIEVIKDVSFSIRNEDGSSNTYATIESVSGNSAVVKATSNVNYRNKYFYLKCGLVDDVNVFNEIKIKLASLI